MTKDGEDNQEVHWAILPLARNRIKGHKQPILSSEL